MRKLFLFVVGMLFMFTACQEDEFSGPEMATSQTITVNIPQTGIAARAAGDGSQINRCILEVYRNGELYGERRVVAVSGKTATFNDLRLVSNQTYDFVFWADCATGSTVDDFADNHYVTTDLTNITVKDQYTGNNDEFDAFFHCEKGYKVTQAFALDVTLKRPFGQLNVTTTDWNLIPDADLKPTDVKVEFVSLANTFNALTGVASGEEPVTYEAAVADVATGVLTVDYIFASETEGATLVDYVMTFLNNSTEIAKNDAFTNIPVRRNYRTNVMGNLLTKKGTINVEVKPEFETPDMEVNLQEVNTVADIAQAIKDGARDIVVKTELTENVEIQLPHSLTEEQAAEKVTITIPKTDKNITFSYATETGQATKEIELFVETTGTLVLNLSESTVTLRGSVGSLEATTAANTLIIGEGVTVNELTVKGGNVQVYGKVGKIVSKPAGTIVSLHVTTPERLADYAATETAMFNKVVIENDIDFKGRPFQITRVNNVEFDGKGHKISNFTVENSQMAGFVCDAVSVTFRNLTLENAKVKAVNDGSGNAYAGTFIGRTYGTIVMDKCVALNSQVEGVNKVGGLVGFVAENHIEATDCKVEGCIVSNEDVPEESGQMGGFVGYLGNLYNSTCSFKNCSVEKTTINAYMNREDRTISKFIGCFQGSEVTDVLIINKCSVKDVTLNGMNEMAQSFVSTYGDLLGGQRYGKGTVTITNSPLVYSIAYPAQLYKIAEMANADKGKKYFSKATIQLDADIDLKGKNWVPADMFSASNFVFDGKGHKIINMSSIHKLSTRKYGNGFFSNLVGATVKNVTFEKAIVKSGKFVSANKSGNIFGIVTGYSYGTVTFENVHVSGSEIVGFGKVGGIIGMAADKGGVTKMVNCSVSDTEVECRYNGGGLIGLAQNQVELKDCSTSNVKWIKDIAVKNQYVELNTTLTKDGKTVEVKGTYWHYVSQEGLDWYYVAWGDYYTDYYYSGAPLASGGFIADGLCHNK